MPSTEEEALVGGRFYFEADGLTDLMVLELSGISSENPTAGGNKVMGSGKQAVTFVQATPTQVKFTPITVKIVATNNKDFFKWYDDCNKNSGGASSWDQERKTASIVVYDQNSTEQARWDIQNCYPSKYESSNFEANSGEVADETITLVHEGIERVQ